MKIEKERPTVFRVTLHAYELSALIAAARWVVEGAEGELSDEALDQLRQVVESYDAERQRLDAA
ncbi:MAG: hypothetical protein GVY18_01775 [Bacteroidetes bacterium]|jgi:hypothetical protein|nr:hypothetical protein [Bacteroidota bacterium]